MASEVSAPRMISTMALSVTGCMKCIPTTRSGRPEAAAISVMLRVEVLVMKMRSRWQAWPSWRITSFLRSRSSVTVSMTMSVAHSSRMSLVNFTRERMTFFSDSVMPHLASSRSRLAASSPRERAAASSDNSSTITLMPLEATFWAMDLPMKPPPTMPSFLNSTVILSRGEIHSEYACAGDYTRRSAPAHRRRPGWGRGRGATR